MKQNQNSIGNAIFSFNYESKNMALRCNSLIETIFDSQIIPEMETAISNIVPKEFSVHLETLEINIGTINERELPIQLAKRIKIALENALQKRLNLKNDVGKNPSDSAQTTHFLKGAIEFYLKKGYLPSWIPKETSFNKIITSFMMQSSNDVILLLKKYSGNESIMSRLSFTIESKVFESLVYAINEVHHQWILDFRNSLNSIENKEIIKGFGRLGAGQLINSFILTSLLSKSSNSFNKQKFIEMILLSYLSSFPVDKKVLLTALKKTNKIPETTKIIEDIINSAKNNKLLANKQNNQEQTVIKEPIAKQLENPKKKNNTVSNKIRASLKTIKIYKRKIISYYLDFGYLPKKHNDLNQIDLQQIFNEFLKTNDSFLADKLKVDCDPERLFDRIKSLIQDGNWSSLHHYLTYYFEDSIAFLIKFISNLKKEIKQNRTLRLKDQFNENELIIKYLISSKGILLPSLCMFLVNRKIIENLISQKDVLINLIDSLHLKLQEPETKATSLQLIEVNTNTANFEIQRIIEQDLLKLMYSFKNPNFSQTSTSAAQVHKLVYYLQMYPEDFRAICLQIQLDLVQVMILFRIHMPDEIWKLFEKTLSSEQKLKEIFKKFHKEVDAIFLTLKDKNFNITGQFLKLKEIDGTGLKTILAIALKKEIYFDALSADFNNKKGVLEFGTKLKQFQNYFTALMNFVPKSLSNDFWTKLVLRFSFQIKIDAKTLLTKEFATRFLKQLRKELKEIDKEKLYYKILFDFNNSESKLLKSLFGAFNNDKLDENLFDIQHLKSNASKNLSVLAFYAHNQYLPWWSEKRSPSELLDAILDQSLSLDASFETIFLKVEDENRFIELLISKLPVNLIVVFSLISSKHEKMNRLWRGTLARTERTAHEDELKLAKKLKSNTFIPEEIKIDFENKNQLQTKQLQEALYFLSDDEILKKWSNKNTSIKKQILGYIRLSPYLYYKDLNPTKWKTLVYNFAFTYYKSAEVKLNEDFHKALVHFLIQQNSKTPWKDLFKGIYSKTQITNDIENKIFPDGLLSYIGEKAKQKQITESNDKNFDQELNLVGDEIKVYNSGLIILWPFLTRFFEKLELVINGNFINDKSRNRTIYLLQYLAYNRIDFTENELVLNKLLVGLPLTDHLIPISELTIAEKELAASLLNGVKSNWAKVKNSSIEAIQKTFIRREGLLTMQEEKATLKIDKKGVDVLMSGISWNIALVKLPWMQFPLFIEWE